MNDQLPSPSSPPSSAPPSSSSSSSNPPPDFPDVVLPEHPVSEPAPSPSSNDLPAPAAPVRALRRPSYWFLGVVAVSSLVADLLTKTWAEKTLENAAKIPTPKTLVPRFLGFLLAKNQGGAWGLLQNAPENVRKPFFVVVSVLAILFIVSLYRRLHPEQRALRWGLPLVLGGALGNLVDRIRYGFVIDFIDVQATWGGSAHHWPTFNVADIAICIGVILMALDMLSPRRPEPLPHRSAPMASPAHVAAGDGMAASQPPSTLPEPGSPGDA